MELQTSRLRLIALNREDLDIYLKGHNKFERKYGLADIGRTVAEPVRDMVKKLTLPKIEKALGETYLFITFWIVVDKDNNSIVAEMGFKGAPDTEGSIEIGYGTMPHCRSKGYMTEAVGCLTAWALTRNEVNLVLAETHEENLPSMRVLEKNGLERYDKKGEMYWWKKCKVSL